MLSLVSGEKAHVATWRTSSVELHSRLQICPALTCVGANHLLLTMHKTLPLCWSVPPRPYAATAPWRKLELPDWLLHGLSMLSNSKLTS
jgi:hypothetical protein